MNCYNKQNQVPFLLEAFFDKGNICVIFCPHELLGNASANWFLFSEKFVSQILHLCGVLP